MSPVTLKFVLKAKWNNTKIWNPLLHHSCIRLTLEVQRKMMTRESPLMEVQGIRSFEIPGTGSNAFLWRQTATSRPKTTAFAKEWIHWFIWDKTIIKIRSIIKTHLCSGGEACHRQLWSWQRVRPESWLPAGIACVGKWQAKPLLEKQFLEKFLGNMVLLLSINQFKETRLVISLSVLGCTIFKFCCYTGRVPLYLESMGCSAFMVIVN